MKKPAERRDFTVVNYCMAGARTRIQTGGAVDKMTLPPNLSCICRNEWAAYKWIYVVLYR